MKFLTVATCLLSAVLAAPTPYGSVPDEKSPYPVPEGGEYSNPPYVPPVDTNPTYPTPPNGNGEGNGDGYGNGDDGSYGNGNGNGNGNGGGYGNGGGNGGHGNGSGNGGHGNGSGNGGGHGNGGGNGDGGEPLCPSGLLYSNPQCCSTDVLGVADLDCATPSSTPSSPSDFGKICAKAGKQAKCCAIPVAGLGVLCQPAIGAN